jgi:2-hydroxychromene-2-carboxylate isomerase
VAPHRLVPAFAERLLHPRTGMALAGALELDVTDREPPTLQGSQVAARDHEVAPQQHGVDRTTAEQGPDGREVLGLEERHVTLPACIQASTGGRPAITDESGAGDRFGFPDDLDRSPSGGAQADPEQPAGLGQVGDEAADLHRGSVRCPVTDPREATLLLLHFDYVSAPAAVAVLRLQRLVDQGAAIGFAGIDVLGLASSIPVTLDQLEGIERARGPALEVGLTLRRPTLRPPTLAAHLVGDLAGAVGLGAAWRERCLRSYWEEGGDLGDERLLLDLAAATGLERRAVADLLDDRPRRVQLRQRMLTTRSRGIGDVPVLEVAGGTFVPADLPEDDLRQLASL